MSSRLHIFLTGYLALLLAALLALAPVTANPTSGGYQLFERAASGISTDIQLASLKNFAPLPETASEYANAPNRTADSYFGQQRNFWTADPIEFNGNRVYQRNDQFDPGQVSSWRENGQVVQGTNLERMASGRAPIGNDGRPINLHHMTQTQDGAIAEVTQSFHQQNFGTIHINTGGLPSGINRGEFDAWRADYWRSRAGTWGQ